MADPTDKLPGQAPGRYYVDSNCIDCDVCRETAPGNFAANEHDGFSFVVRQPENDEEEAQCEEALESCPVEAIGDDGEDELRYEMKIAVSSTGPSLDAPLDERFGRCSCFVIVNSTHTDFEPVSNPCATQGHGAGIQAARLVAEQGASVVLTGRCGPNASDTLAAAGVTVVTGCGGTVREALEWFNTENGPS